MFHLSIAGTATTATSSTPQRKKIPTNSKLACNLLQINTTCSYSSMQNLLHSYTHLLPVCMISTYKKNIFLLDY